MVAGVPLTLSLLRRWTELAEVVANELTKGREFHCFPEFARNIDCA
jgi:hypothetical protein